MKKGANIQFGRKLCGALAFQYYLLEAEIEVCKKTIFQTINKCLVFAGKNRLVILTPFKVV